ncbi:MAG: sigma 54-interacting transcriptional regulator [Kiritimatiellia bacterium]
MAFKTIRLNNILSAGAESILESISDGVFTVDADWRITSFNRAAEKITGIPRREALGRNCAEVFKASMCEADCALRKTIETGKPVIDKPAFIVDVDGRRIPVSVSTALLEDGKGKVIGGAETFRDLSLVEELRKEIEGHYKIGDLISRNAEMRRIFEVLPQIAVSASTVLIQGETGTGKELVARAIHAHSPRAKGPFVAVNCGALPDTLLESELFGYKAGAFTGAEKDKPGRFARAEGGTIFLDEISEISPALQVRLLRVLQEKTYEPLGGVKSVKADVRVIAAANRDLDELVKKGVFRQDLFYRVNIVRIELPPLRKRKEDIPLLAEHFVRRFNNSRDRAVRGVGAGAMAVLMTHDFPGNVRELENIIERAFVLCGSGEIEPRHLPEELMARAPALKASADIQGMVRVAEAQAIRAALEKNKFSRLAAARELGIHKATLFRKIKRLGIVLPEKDGRARNIT